MMRHYFPLELHISPIPLYPYAFLLPAPPFPTTPAPYLSLPTLPTPHPTSLPVLSSHLYPIPNHYHIWSRGFWSPWKHVEQLGLSFGWTTRWFLAACLSEGSLLSSGIMPFPSPLPLSPPPFSPNILPCNLPSLPYPLPFPFPPHLFLATKHHVAVAAWSYYLAAQGTRQLSSLLSALTHIARFFYHVIFSL